MSPESGEIIPSERISAGLLSLPRDDRGRIRWSLLKDTPEIIVEVIESEAQAFLGDGQILTLKALQQARQFTLINAIGRFYPGKLSALQEKLGVASQRTPSEYWKQEGSLELIRRQVKEFSEEYGKVTSATLRKNGRSGLATAVGNQYPGSWIQLRKDLGWGLTRRPDGYWDQTTIEEESRLFYQQEGGLSHGLLRRKGLHGFARAIKDYPPGGMEGLKRHMGIEATVHPAGYWTVYQIRQEAKSFLAQEGELSNRLMRAKRMFSLAGMITNSYPGGWTQLRKDLGLELLVHHHGYWTVEQIELEATKFYQTYGFLSTSSMVKEGFSSLCFMVRTKYPGGIKALKAKLGIPGRLVKKEVLSSEEANEELRKLLEGGT